eukprot:43772_1
MPSQSFDDDAEDGMSRSGSGLGYTHVFTKQFLKQFQTQATASSGLIPHASFKQLVPCLSIARHKYGNKRGDYLSSIQRVILSLEDGLLTGLYYFTSIYILVLFNDNKMPKSLHIIAHK